MELSKDRFILLWLGSAMLVILVRTLNAADLGYDMSIQIQAAQNLLQGHGLSIYSIDGEDDLAKPSRLLTLTYFPAGYSFCAAALIALGFSMGGVVKTLGAAGTILGWWGWAGLAHPFFSQGLKRGFAWRWAGAAVAVSSPLLFTPPLNTTDMFLWAAVPWVLCWVVRASDENASRGRWLDALAGAVCGLSILIRYSSVFLAGYAAFLIFTQARTYPRVLARRGAAFTAGMLPLLAVQLYFIQFVSSPETRPGGVTLSREVAGELEMLWRVSGHLTSANYAMAWWMPRKVVEFLTQPGNQAPWLLAVTFAVLGLLPPLFATKLGCRRLTGASRDVRVAAIGLFVAVPLFLWACWLVGGVAYTGELRYYLPLVPLAVFVAYAFALPERSHESKVQALLRITSLGYVTAYLCMAAVGVVLLLVPGERGSGRRAKALGMSGLPWPTMKLIHEFSAARGYVIELLKDEPETVLVTNLERWYYADPGIDRSRLHRQSLRASYVTGPAHILIVTVDPPGAAPDAIYAEYWPGYKEKLRPVNYFEHLPDLHLLRRFPEENVKVLEARIPDGSRIALNRPTAE